MADFALKATPVAKRALDGLRGPASDAWRRARPEYEAQGCRVAGYRLLDATGSWSEYCCRHLYAKWRVVTQFERGVVRVVAVGEHDGPAFYEGLAAELGIRAEGQGRDQKPDCCGPSGWPSIGTTGVERRGLRETI